MDVLASRIDTGSESFQKNRQDMQALLAEVEAQLALARAGGGDRSVARHRERGKLLIRFEEFKPRYGRTLVCGSTDAPSPRPISPSRR